jgi:Spy/CpxP family protein refolding chaperone
MFASRAVGHTTSTPTNMPLSRSLTYRAGHLDGCFRTGVALCMLGFAIGGGPLAAQSGASPTMASPRPASTPQAGMPGMASMDDAMPTLMASSPHAILAHRTALGLTSAQIASLQSLEQGAKARDDSTMVEMAPLHEALLKAVDATPLDESAVRSLSDNMGALHAKMMVGMMRSIHDARAQLTAKQRNRLAGIAHASMVSQHAGQSRSCGAM